MKTQTTIEATILSNIEASKEIQKNIKALKYYDSDQFLTDAYRYIEAIKEGRIICSIGSVSKSGMSRTIKFLAPEQNKSDNKHFSYLNFYCLFRALGFKESRSRDHYFTINGCGMDMIFHTNYTIINRLKSLGFMEDSICQYLAQQTPPVI